jgi:DNA-directed RNA polymerase-3 subunit RPC5
MDVEMVADSILESPKGSEYGGDVIPAEATGEPHDAPGPSSTFMPPAEPDDLAAPPVSPPLPPLHDDDDDEVVARLPVYISPSLGTQLALFQYPLQHRTLRVPNWAADRGKRITSRVKENVGRVEVEVPIDANPSVWRDERARELAFVPAAVNGREEEEEGKKKKKKEAGWGDKMRLRSEAVPTKEGTYFSGIVHEGE